MAIARHAPNEQTRTSERLSVVALEFFFKVAALWQLTPSEQRTLLGSIPESTYYKWLKSPASARLQRDQLDRISHLVGIYKSINILLPRHESADNWVRRPNDAALFKGGSALDYMVSGGFEHIVDVRRYLDQERGW